MQLKNGLSYYQTILSEEYGFKDFVLSLVRDGFDNDLWEVKTKDNKFALRVGKRKLGQAIKFEVDLIKHLEKNKLNVPKIIQTLKKESFVLAKDDSALILFDFIEGKSLEVDPDHKPDLEIVHKAGTLLGNFHKYSLSFNSNIKRRSIFTEFERALVREKLIVKKLHGGEKFIKEVKEYIDWSKSSDFPKGIIHNDYQPANIMVDEKQNITMIDFDWASPGPFAKDVGLALALWSYPNKGEQHLKKHWDDVYEEFLNGYNLTAPQKFKNDRDLIKWINFGCLSDTATFLADLPEDDTKITEVTQCRRYLKFLYFDKIKN
ncbi:phosphotransferase [Candidatus Beckwithbacteria bacterium]|nr:phosphotransferase [Candidatus Beckwithbacteria bacterium]